MSLLTTPAWLAAMSGRLPPTVALRADGVEAHAFVQHEPLPREFFDLQHVLTTTAPALPITREPIDSPPWVPALTVMVPGYECLPTGPRAGDPEALHGLVSAALAHDVPTVAFLYTRPGPLETVLHDRGFTRVPLSMTWDLHLPGTGITDYLAAFPRKRRKEIRREMRSVADVHREEPDLDELAALRCQLSRKYRGAADIAVERRKLAALAAMDSITLVARPDSGNAVGFAMFARHDGDWTCTAVGFDYTDARSRLAYFGTAYYAAAEHAYAERVRTIGYGQGSWQAKRSRGCTGTPLTGWVRTRDPLLAEALAVSAATTRREVL
ncbi:hypothetical protein BBK82_28800 [Lentzea guizhouensis]|uniref:BioF2-like acetyltransferase domain-containing protein n=1 Tax=Lentzea guizhouensis TaxID=1586287 RepID=A0A1B2HP33_9PSEU|nr:hypothetical protein [Lentzea guizhouensis]ANZ39455.1 hypothetical protein BBK82_28800 [Lentzea guizhouensis]